MLPPDETEPRAELAPKEELLSYFNGFAIYQSPRLAPGWIEFRDAKGNVLGSINGVGQIHIAKRQPS